MKRVLAIIWRWGRTRLYPLTKAARETRGALGAKYRLIDIPISKKLHQLGRSPAFTS